MGQIFAKVQAEELEKTQGAEEEKYQEGVHAIPTSAAGKPGQMKLYLVINIYRAI